MKYFPPLLLLTILSGCGSLSYYQSPNETHLPRAVVEIPSKFSAGAFFIKASVDNGIPRWFLLDTGADIIVINEQIFPASSMNTTLYGFTITGSTGEKSEKAPVAHLQTVSLGDAAFQRVSAVVFPAAIFSLLDDLLGEEVAGIIGSNLFQEVTLTVDYANEKVLLSKNPVGDTNNKDILDFASTKLQPHIISDIGNTQYSVMLDTGVSADINAGSILDHTIIEKVVPAGLVGTANSRYRNSKGKLNGNVKFGHFQFTQPLIALDLESSQESDGSTNDRTVFYGGTILRHFVTHFDMVNKRVWFQPNNLLTKIESIPWKTSGIGFEWRDDAWYINDFIPGTLGSEKGLKLGDQVVRMNGEPFDINGYYNIVYQAKSVTLAIVRADEPFEIEVPVVELIQ